MEYISYLIRDIDRGFLPTYLLKGNIITVFRLQKHRFI